MALLDRLRAARDVLLGVSTYQPPGKGFGPQVDDRAVEEAREALGGNLQPLPSTRLRWYLEDLEAAQSAADTGDLKPAAQLCAAMRRDGFLRGLKASRTRGLIRLPKRFYGDPEVAEVLRARNGTRSVFDEMFPPAELALLDSDGIDLGVGVAELVPVPGRSFPVMVRLEPEFLSYRWNENRWYFQSVAGLLPITPGDGRWILHVPGGRLTPWREGIWAALGRSFINKEHAIMYRSNYAAKLANPARLAYAPAGATEAQRLGFFQRILAWGVNTVLEMPPGWEAKLLESNGRGWEVFQRQIDTCDLEYMVNVAGQVVTTTGGVGFANAEVPEAIRKDLIQYDGDALAYTIDTQGLPQYLISHYGDDAIWRPTIVEWDTGSPVDKERETRTLGQVADAIAKLTVSLAAHDKRPDVAELATRFAVPTLDGAAVALAPPAEDAAKGAAPLKTAPVAAPPAQPTPRAPTDGDDTDLAD